MTKRSRELIALLVFFICVILIFQITQQNTAPIEKNTTLPKDTKVFVRINQKEIFKKVFISELYGPNASEFVKKLVKLTSESEGQEVNSTYTAFIEHSDLSLIYPLDLITLSIANKDVLFLRAKSHSITNEDFLFNSNHDYLYLQLNEKEISQKVILKAINNTASFPITTSKTDDVTLYKLEGQNLVNMASINLKNHHLSVLLPQLSTDHKTCLELEPKGFHVFMANKNNMLDFISKTTPDIKLKSLSINYYGLNSYSNPIIFPDADYLLEFENKITSTGLIQYLNSALKGMDFSHKNEDISKNELVEEAKGQFFIGDLKLYFKRINESCFFIGADTKMTKTQISELPFIISGKPSQLMTITNLSGWKALLAEEFIAGIPILRQLKTTLDNISPIETSQKNKATVIDIKFKNNHSLYSQLLDLILSL